MDPVVYAAQALCKIVHQVKREMTLPEEVPVSSKKGGSGDGEGRDLS